MHIDGGDPSAGACYYWGDSVWVKSTTGYRIMVDATPANPRLDPTNASPGGYNVCTGGEPLGSNMYPSASPPGTWRHAQSAPGGRTHPFGLGLEVRWDDAPSTTLGEATLTFTAIAE